MKLCLAHPFTSHKIQTTEKSFKLGNDWIGNMGKGLILLKYFPYKSKILIFFWYEKQNSNQLVFNGLWFISFNHCSFFLFYKSINSYILDMRIVLIYFYIFRLYIMQLFLYHISHFLLFIFFYFRYYYLNLVNHTNFIY